MTTIASKSILVGPTNSTICATYHTSPYIFQTWYRFGFNLKIDAMDLMIAKFGAIDLMVAME